MKRPLYFEKLRGVELPYALRNITWEGTGQQSGQDPLGNVWIRNSPGKMYLSVDSDYRMSVYMTLTLFVSSGVIEGHDWFATLASHGRPCDVSPQRREADQVARLIKPFFEP